MNTKIMNIANLCFNFNFTQVIRRPQDTDAFEGVILNTFKKSIDAAEKEEIKYLLLTGKLFDEETLLVYEIDELVDLFRQKQGIRFVIAPDIIDVESSWYNVINWPTNVSILSKKQDYIKLEDDELVIYRGDLNESLRESSYRKVCVKSSSNEITADSDASLYLLYDENSYSAKGNVYCPGTFLPYTYGDFTGGYIVLDLQENSVSHRFVANNEYRLIKKTIEINETMGLEDIIEKTKEALTADENVYYEVEYTGIINKEIPSNLSSAIKDKINNHIYVKLINNTRKDYDIQGIKNTNIDNLIGLFIEEVQNDDISEEEKTKIIEYGLDYLL